MTSTSRPAVERLIERLSALAWPSSDQAAITLRALLDERDAAEAIAKYAAHDDGCAAYDRSNEAECSCGLTAAEARVTALEGT